MGSHRRYIQYTHVLYVGFRLTFTQYKIYDIYIHFKIIPCGLCVKDVRFGIAVKYNVRLYIIANFQNHLFANDMLFRINQD